ncbi:MAG: PASTA domain-containing protein [Thermoleophilia bacterium]|nr:PASTA domain-containing protein [Thermoleophilia bacterium]
MPADLEARLREVLRPDDPPTGSRERMLNRLMAAPGRRRRPGRRSWGGGLAAAAMIAGFAVFLVLILPRGAKRPAPLPPAAFAVLKGGSPSDLTALGVTVEDLNFPGLAASTLRTVRRVGDTTILAGRNRDGLVCLSLVGPEPGPTPAAKPGQAIVTHVRAWTACGLPAAVERSALVQVTWTGRQRPVILVPDGVRLRGPRGAIPVTRNVAVAPVGTAAVTATYADGTRRRLRTDGQTTMPLAPADRRAIATVTVPDLPGARGGDAGRLLEASLLTAGSTTAEPSDAVPAGRVLRQSPAPGTTAPTDARVDIVLGSPGGTRTSPSPATALALTEFPAGPGTLAFERATLGALRGTVRVLLFVRTRAEASSARWVPPTAVYGSGTIVVVDGGRAAAARVLRRDTSASLAIDPDGSLQAALGVRAPATVVLDREGRVAVRSGRLPSGPLPDARLDIDAITYALQLEPRSAGMPPLEIPRQAWWLTTREPLDPADVPGAVPVAGSCAAERERVWAFGPAGGLRLWISVSASSGLQAAPAQVVVVAPVRHRAPAPTSVSSCDRFPAARDAAGPAVDVSTERTTAGIRRIFVVRDGYDRAELDGRSFPVVNGMAVTEGGKPFGQRIVFSGPAGRAVVTG